jgi:hypothetical protein
MVAFQGPTNSYVCDLHLGTAHLITSDGINPVISGDGRFVAFERPRRNGLIITNYDIVVIDALFDVESLASINIMGTGGGNGPSRSPVLSSDGRFVVFKSQATDLVSGDNNGVTDLFVRDMVLGQSMLVSLNQSGMSGGNRLSGNPVMGADGHTVIFESFASDLTSNDFNESKDLFALRLGAGDSDNDGMDDAWEISYFGNLSRDGTADSDNDGATELAEFKAGTNPINDSSVLSVVTLQNIGTGAVSVLWNSVPGKSYVVQFKSGLEEPEWQSLPGSVVADGSTASKADASAQADDHRYYRVVLASP